MTKDMNDNESRLQEQLVALRAEAINAGVDISSPVYSENLDKRLNSVKAREAQNSIPRPESYINQRNNTIILRVVWLLHYKRL